jgi:hypothetical protein
LLPAGAVGRVKLAPTGKAPPFHGAHPEQFTCTVQTHPQIAVPVRAELAGDRISR